MKTNFEFNRLLLLVTALLCALSATQSARSTAQALGAIDRVSLSTGGVQGNGYSWGSRVSANGRYVVFQSEADNLVADDTNGVEDIFLRDRLSGVTERVSLSSSGEQGNGASLSPGISADGEFVAFLSLANNLAVSDTNGFADTFLHNRSTGETIRISVSASGEQGDGASFLGAPSVSADGRYIAFSSYANNLTPEGDFNDGSPDIYVRDVFARTTRRASVSSAGVQGDDWSWKPSLSADGRYVAFASWSDNLVADDGNQAIDIFVRDLIGDTTSLISVNALGELGNGDSQYPSISADGRYVSYASTASNLTPGDENGWMDIFRYDRSSGETLLVSVSSAGAAGDGDSIHAEIAGDGQTIFFDSTAANLAAGDENEQIDLFVRDLNTGVTWRASESDDGAEGNQASRLPSVSQDGCVLVFASEADNLIANDTNQTQDIFVRVQDCRTTHAVFLPLVLR